MSIIFATYRFMGYTFLSISCEYQYCVWLIINYAPTHRKIMARRLVSSKTSHTSSEYLSSIETNFSARRWNELGQCNWQWSVKACILVFINIGMMSVKIRGKNVFLDSDHSNKQFCQFEQQLREIIHMNADNNIIFIYLDFIISKLPRWKWVDHQLWTKTIVS